MSSSLKGNLAKAGLVGVTGAVLSVLALGGLESVQVAGGMWAPRFAIHGIVLGASSAAASYAVPMIVPFVSVGSPALRRWETLVLEPMVLGTISLGIESLLAPNAEEGGAGGTFKTILVGAAASVGAAYVSEGMGFSESVI